MNRLYFALCLVAFTLRAASPAPAATAATDPAGAYTTADALFVEALRSVQHLQECQKLSGLMGADIVEKEAALKAEFGVRIPAEFTEILIKKRKRKLKQDTLCASEMEKPGVLFANASNALRAIEPSSLPGIAVRRKKFDKATLSYNQMIAPAKKEKP